MNNTYNQSQASGLIKSIFKGSLIKQIIIGMIAGAVLAIAWPQAGNAVGILGDIFVGALKAIAPVLVFILVCSSIASHRGGTKTGMGSILALYVIGTFLAALLAVVASFTFPQTIHLQNVPDTLSPPQNIIEVLKTLVMNMVDNPFNAITNANYIGILVWAVALGATLRVSGENTIKVINDLSNAVSMLVRLIIRLAPLGIFGLVAITVSETGFEALKQYASLITLLLGCMLLMALVVNPLIVFIKIRKNPYPLVLTCLRESGVTAFFTRSSAANIPVNMALCERLGLNKDTYSVSIPLGATINMSGAAITITILTLAAVNTLGINIDMPTALLLSVIASISACGASGVAGGSLLLIPLACSLFGISNDIAMQVVGVGFVIGVLQDSAETALNSSTDVLFTAAAEKAQL